MTLAVCPTRAATKAVAPTVLGWLWVACPHRMPPATYPIRVAPPAPNLRGLPLDASSSFS